MRSFFCWGPRGVEKNKQRDDDAESRVSSHNSRTVKYLICGSISLVIGCLTLIWPPYDWLKDEVLRMRKGLPPYNWWAVPAADVYFKIHLFNVTNYDAVMNGTDKKLKMEDIGPYIYLEKLTHTNVRHNSNGTMSFTATRELEFIPDKNTLSLNDTLIVPNLAYLGMASYLADWPFFVRLGFNLLVRRYDPSPLKKITVYDLLWNNTDPLLDMAFTLVPSLLPVNNIGYLRMIYDNFTDEESVFIGPSNARRYFTMDKYNGRNRFGIWSNDTCDTVKNATEGILYHHNIQKDDALHFYRKTVCRVTPIYFAEELERYGMTSYRFTLPLDTFYRPQDGTDDCYSLPGQKPLPDGISHVSKCYYDLPVVESLPHFLAVDPAVLNQIEGFTPDPEKHGSFAIVEPNTGVPLLSTARMQSSLLMADVKGMGKAAQYSNMYIPLFWAELSQEGLPKIIRIPLYILVVVIPNIQGFLSAVMIAVGTMVIYFKVIKIHRLPRKSKTKGTYTSLDLLPQIQ